MLHVSKRIILNDNLLLLLLFSLVKVQSRLKSRLFVGFQQKKTIVAVFKHFKKKHFSKAPTS